MMRSERCGMEADSTREGLYIPHHTSCIHCLRHMLQMGPGLEDAFGLANDHGIACKINFDPKIMDPDLYAFIAADSMLGLQDIRVH